MTPFLALLHDAYRELNSKRLFWVVLGISVLVVAVFSGLGLDGPTVTLFGWHTPMHSRMMLFISPASFFKQQFVNLGIKVWLSWLACILALISTAGIFPDFLVGGSVDLYLSKPISRLSLFLTKYLSALIFVTLQVTVFCLAGFVLLGVRAHSWEPGLLIAIPLVVLMFSYLYAVCTLVGVLTRSTVASLLLTLLFWIVLWAIQQGESLTLLAKNYNDFHAQQIDRQIASVEKQLTAMHAAVPSTQTLLEEHPVQPQANGNPADSGRQHRDDRQASSNAGANTGANTGLFKGLVNFFKGDDTPRQKLEDQLANLHRQRLDFPDGQFETAHTIAYWIYAPAPKTQGTIEILERQIVRRTDLPPMPSDEDAGGKLEVDSDNHEAGPPGGRREGQIMQRKLDEAMRARSAGFVLGTSILFELIVVGLAAWIFCRRDY